MRPAWKLSACPLFSTLILAVSKVIVLSCQADSPLLKALQWFPTASDKAQLLKMV